jgi:hypothetical protein
MRGFLRQLLMLYQRDHFVPRPRWRPERVSPDLTALGQIACTPNRLREIGQGFLPCPAGQERSGRLAWSCMHILEVARLLRAEIATRKTCGVIKPLLRARRRLGRYTLPASRTFLNVRVVRFCAGAVVPIRRRPCGRLLAPLFNVCGRPRRVRRIVVIGRIVIGRIIVIVRRVIPRPKYRTAYKDGTVPMPMKAPMPIKTSMPV